MNETAKVDALSQSSQVVGTTAGANVLTAPEPFADAEGAGRFLGLRPGARARKGVISAHPLSEGLRKVWRFRLSELDSTTVPI